MVPHLTRFEPLGVMAIFGTYLRAGRGSDPVWLQGPKTPPKVPVIYGATSGGPNPKLMMTLKKACLLPLNIIKSDQLIKVWPGCPRHRVVNTLIKILLQLQQAFSLLLLDIIWKKDILAKSDILARITAVQYVTFSKMSLFQITVGLS